MVSKKSYDDDAKSVQSLGKEKRSKAFGWLRGKSKKAKKNGENIDQTPLTSNKKSKIVIPSERAPTMPSLASPSGILKKEATSGFATTNGGSSKPSSSAATVAAAATKLKKTKKPSWFCRTKYFEKMCNTAFDAIDSDHGGTVDETELYSGLLLMHLKLGCYAGPAACRPLSRERCATVFKKFDADNSKSLDRKEFHDVMAVLFGNVFARVMVQWSMTLMIVPLVAQALLDWMEWLFGKGVEVMQNLDEHSELANSIELTMESATTWCVDHSPSKLLMVGNSVGEYLKMVPESVWEAVPLTLISAVLGIVAVPWCIFKTDDLFQYLADRKAKSKND